MILEVKNLPTLLNRLYIPIIKNGKPSIIKNPKTKEFTKYINDICLINRVKPFKKDISFYMDILISKRNNYDIDGLLKLLFDSLNGLAYIDDKQIVDLRVRKHLNETEDKLIIKIEEV